MSQKNRKGQTALEAYQEEQAFIQHYLADIRNELLNGTKDEDVTWAHQGSMANFRSQLKEVRDQICRKGEYKL